AVSDIPVYFEVKKDDVVIASFSGTVPGPVSPASSVNYTFPATFDMLALGTYSLTAYTDYPGDANPANDTAFSTLNVIQYSISTFPYLEDFNADDGTWLTGQTNPANTTRKFEYGIVPYLGGAEGEGNSFYLNMSG